MLGIKLTNEGAERFPRVLQGHLNAWQDLDPLAQRIAELMRDDNLEARLSGVDRQGTPFAPLKHGDPLKPAEIRRRGGDGPPLAPHGGASRIVTEYLVSIFHPTKWIWVVLGAWPGLFWLKYHGRGEEHSKRLPMRDPVGVRPETHEQIMTAADDFGRQVLSGGP